VDGGEDEPFLAALLLPAVPGFLAADAGCLLPASEDAAAACPEEVSAVGEADR